MPATPAWLAFAEAALNRGIQASAQATTLARRLHGTALRVEIDGLTSVRASVIGARLLLDGAADGAAATLSGSPAALLQLSSGGAQRANAPALGPRPAAARIRGDAEIANGYRELFALARPDLEEELSRVVGDLPARRLSLLARQVLSWLRRTRRTAFENVVEYLQEESRDLVNAAELTEFLQGVDSLREAADRVEARLAHLERRLQGAV